MQNPYKGLYQYSSSDENSFFGRDQEAEEIIELIKSKQLVTLYGDSGTGKTSLIHAKIFPMLCREYFVPIYIRLNYASEVTPLDQVKERIHTELKKWMPEIRTFNGKETLIDYVAKTNIFDGLIKPILFFDQFEELFTLGPKYVHPSDIDMFVEQLAQLVEIRLPASFSRREELLEKTYIENILRFSVVLSLRQDFIAFLDDFNYRIPSIVFSKYRIKKFSFTQAYDAIMRSTLVYSEVAAPIIDMETTIEMIRLLGKETVISDDTRTLDNRRVKELLGDISKPGEKEKLMSLTVDPTVLSLYSYQLFENAKLREGPIRITKRLIEELTPDDVIKNYYKNKLRKYGRVKKGMERYLISKEGRRLLIPYEDFLSKAKLKESEVLEVEQKSALLRIYGKRDDRGREIEIVHDQLAKHALNSRKIREANRIKWSSVVAASFILVIAITITYLYVNAEKNQVNVKYLRSQIDALNDAERTTRNALAKKTKELIATREKYDSTLAFSSKFETDDKAVNEQMKNLQDALRQKMHDNDTLRHEMASMRLQVDKMNGEKKSFDQQIAKAKSSVDDERRRASEYQNAMNSIEDKVRSELDAGHKKDSIRIGSLEEENSKLTETVKLYMDSVLLLKRK